MGLNRVLHSSLTKLSSWYVTKLLQGRVKLLLMEYYYEGSGCLILNTKTPVPQRRDWAEQKWDIPIRQKTITTAQKLWLSYCWRDFRLEPKRTQPQEEVYTKDGIYYIAVQLKPKEDELVPPIVECMLWLPDLPPNQDDVVFQCKAELVEYWEIVYNEHRELAA